MGEGKKGRKEKKSKRKRRRRKNHHDINHFLINITILRVIFSLNLTVNTPLLKNRRSRKERGDRRTRGREEERRKEAEHGVLGGVFFSLTHTTKTTFLSKRKRRKTLALFFGRVNLYGILKDNFSIIENLKYSIKFMYYVCFSTILTVMTILCC